jgi:integrase
MRKYPSQRELMARTGPGRFSAGDGLYLQVTASGTRSWVFRYRAGDRQHWMGLGSARYLTLALAKQKAIDAQRLRLNGVDPLEAKRAVKRERRASQARAMTFRQAALAYIATQEPSWRGSRSSIQWAQSLQKYVFPSIGSLPVSDIDTPRVLSVLEPIWTRIPESARRIRNRIELVLGYATAHGMRSGDNPARWRGFLENLLPLHQNGKKHLAAMPWRDVPPFMARLQAETDIGARALRLTIFCASRPGEVLGARWPEFDLESAVWTIPAERMKRNREHRVPLSRRTLELLAGLERNYEFVFAGLGGGKLAPHTMVRVLARMGHADLTAHGFRSSFKDWASEATKYPDIVAEQALAHQVGGAVERAYRRGDLLDQRRRLMQDWADFCDRLHAEGAHE